MAKPTVTGTTLFLRAISLTFLVAGGPVLAALLPGGGPNEPWFTGSSSAIKMRVTPRRSLLHFGESVSVKCTVRGGTTIIDMPIIRFSLLFDSNTAVPLNSGIPGITIESEVASRNYTFVPFNIVIEKLTIGEAMYDYLQYGENVFLCSAVNINNDQARQTFIIDKV